MSLIANIIVLSSPVIAAILVANILPDKNQKYRFGIKSKIDYILGNAGAKVGDDARFIWLNDTSLLISASFIDWKQDWDTGIWRNKKVGRTWIVEFPPDKIPSDSWRFVYNAINRGGDVPPPPFDLSRHAYLINAKYKEVVQQIIEKDMAIAQKLMDQEKERQSMRRGLSRIKDGAALTQRAISLSGD